MKLVARGGQGGRAAMVVCFSALQLQFLNSLELTMRSANSAVLEEGFWRLIEAASKLALRRPSILKRSPVLGCHVDTAGTTK